MLCVAEFSKFDPHHWARVQAERVRLGLNAASYQANVPEHPLIGTRVADERTAQTYTVKAVRKEWRRGWFLTAVLVGSDNSQRVSVVESLSCHDESILDRLGDFKCNFQVLS